MGTSFKQLIKNHCETVPAAEGRQVRVIGLDGVRMVAAASSTNLLESEIACLTEGVVPLRYLRNIGTLGTAGQLNLLRSRAVVCGAGGLGGNIVELLARQGVGHLVVIDNGTFDETNLNRQVLSTVNNIGQLKVRAAARRVRRINPAVSVRAVNVLIDRDNVDGLLKGADIVMDGLDNLETRRVVSSACSRAGIPFIHGAIAGFNGQLMSILPGGRGLSGIYGDAAGSDTRGLERITGNPAATAAVIAAWQVQEAVKIITGVGSPVSDRLLFLDFAQGSLEEIPVTGD